ncbi:MAG: hypothetical protein QOJ51_1903 [Acidobacteriaceae bacterium]|nr:hypothetical protein [Acidobacteriaceae bacterium]MEA2259078.1 hypothetical protein [Acidobacteriaceae bacterium]MEA3007445.1 hypothetical protein [Acidobacteriaceae bacterium]
MGKAGSTVQQQDFDGPEPIRLVHTLYLPPTTGIMRMPATRIPLGFKGSDAGDDSGVDPASADTGKGDVQALIRREVSAFAHIGLTLWVV